MRRKHYPAAVLYRLRNQIDINRLIQEELALPWKLSDGYLRFLCPLCSEFHTATNPKTNLARCFRCETNFNPIDLVMATRWTGFVHTVEFLEQYLRSTETRRRQASR